MFLKTRYTTLLLFSSFLLFIFAAIFITYPLIFNLSSIISGFGDELIISWIHNFILDNPFNFNANIFFPFDKTLAYSDFLFTSAFLSAPVLFFIKEPIVSFNFTLISSLALLGFSIFLLAYYCTKNYFISIFSGLLIIFSPAVLDKKVHLQILGIEWVVFSILFFTVFINTNKTKYLLLSLLLLVTQIYNSFMPGYFILFFYATSFLFIFISDRKKFKEMINKNNILIFLSAFLIIIPIVIPFLRVSQEFNYKRDIRESIHFALQPEDLLVAGEDSRFKNISEKIFQNNNFPKNAEIKNGFVGILFTILIALFLFLFIKRFNIKNVILNSFLFTGILGLLLSFGPLLHFNRLTIHDPFPIPLPYLFFYYTLPGFNGFRNSARWEMLFIICFAIVIAIFLSKLLEKYSVNKQIIICLLLISLVIVEFNFPMKFYDAENVLKTPKVYSMLNQSDTAVFIPFCSWNHNCAPVEFKRNYYSIGNYPRTVNGISGFSPPTWEKLADQIAEDFPNQKNLNKFKEMGVNYLIFEKDTYDLYFPNGQEALDFLRNNKTIREVERFDNTYVFKL